ncbi:MAG TPA: BatA domain-containing protein [Bacteroidia bacterium]
MSFLYPSFLVALSALSIPIVVHLFNFRRYKKVYFTNVRFLKEVQQESKSKSTLKRLLILASRLLALTCLVLAFAQPYIPSNHNIKKGARAITIYIDNSFSMQAANKNGNLLDDAKRKAKELVQAASASDKIQLISNDFYATSHSLQSKEQVLDAIDKINISPSVKNLQEVYNRAKSNTDKDLKDAEFFLISDFQKNNLTDFKPDSLVETNFVLLENAPQQNVFIDTCFVESPYFQVGTSQKLHVKIRNLSDKEIENGSLKLYLNSKQIAPVSYKANPNAATDALIGFTCKDTGVQQGMLVIEDFPVTFDDTLYFSFHVNNRIPCLSIHKKDEKSAEYLKSLFSNDSLFTYYDQNDQGIDFSYFSKSNLIVVNGLQTISSGLSQELKKYILAGGSALVFPSSDADKESYNSFFNLFNAATFSGMDTASYRLESKNLPKDLYEGVFEKTPENMDMPSVHQHYSTISNSRSGEEMILKLINGQSFLSMYKKGKGRLYVCTAPLNEKSSSFAKHALFIPTMIKMAILSRPSPPLYYFSGQNEAIDISNINTNGESPLHIAALNKIDFIPELKTTENSKYLLTHGNPTHAGNYKIIHGTITIEGVAFNYNRKESDLACFSSNDLEAMIKKLDWKRTHLIQASSGNMQASLAEIGGGTRLWKTFILLTLLFLAIEICLIKFLK